MSSRFPPTSLFSVFRFAGISDCVTEGGGGGFLVFFFFWAFFCFAVFIFLK